MKLGRGRSQRLPPARSLPASAAAAHESSCAEWLSALGLGGYADLFDMEELQPRLLPLLNDADLVAIGISAVPARRAILAAAGRMPQLGEPSRLAAAAHHASLAAPRPALLPPPPRAHAPCAVAAAVGEQAAGLLGRSVELRWSALAAQLASGAAPTHPDEAAAPSRTSGWQPQPCPNITSGRGARGQRGGRIAGRLRAAEGRLRNGGTACPAQLGSSAVAQAPPSRAHDVGAAAAEALEENGRRLLHRRRWQAAAPPAPPRVSEQQALLRLRTEGAEEEEVVRCTPALRPSSLAAAAGAAAGAALWREGALSPVGGCDGGRQPITAGGAEGVAIAQREHIDGGGGRGVLGTTAAEGQCPPAVSSSAAAVAASRELEAMANLLHPNPRSSFLPTAAASSS